MKTYKVTWYETVGNHYHTEVKANSEEEARLLIDEDIDGTRTNVIEEDHSEVIDWEILSVKDALLGMRGYLILEDDPLNEK